jgi:hypothetical protein
MAIDILKIAAVVADRARLAYERAAFAAIRATCSSPAAGIFAWRIGTIGSAGAAIGAGVSGGTKAGGVTHLAAALRIGRATLAQRQLRAARPQGVAVTFMALHSRLRDPLGLAVVADCDLVVALAFVLTLVLAFSLALALPLPAILRL